MSTRSLYFIISGLGVLIGALAITLTVVLWHGHNGGHRHDGGHEMAQMHHGQNMGPMGSGMGGRNVGPRQGGIAPGGRNVGPRQGGIAPGGGQGQGALPNASGSQRLQQLMQIFRRLMQGQGNIAPGQGSGGGQGGGITPRGVPQPQPAPVRPGAAPTAPTP